MRDGWAGVGEVRVTVPAGVMSGDAVEAAGRNGSTYRAWVPAYVGQGLNDDAMMLPIGTSRKHQPNLQMVSIPEASHRYL